MQYASTCRKCFQNLPNLVATGISSSVSKGNRVSGIICTDLSGFYVRTRSSAHHPRLMKEDEGKFKDQEHLPPALKPLICKGRVM